MALPKSLAKLLKAEAVLHRKSYETDDWGNDVPIPPETLLCVIDASGKSFGQGEVGGVIESTPSEKTKVYCDAITPLVKLGDRIEFPTMVGSNLSTDGIKRKVVDVITYRDKKGLELFQELTTETD